MKHKKFLYFFLTSILLLLMCSCGQKEPSDPNALLFGDYEVCYKDSYIICSESSENVLITTFNFTNNSKEPASYGWNISEKAMQNDQEIESTYTNADIESYMEQPDNYLTEAAPGETLEVHTAHILNSMDPVTMTLSDYQKQDLHTFTIDLSKLTIIGEDTSEESEPDPTPAEEDLTEEPIEEPDEELPEDDTDVPAKDVVTDAKSQQFSNDAGTSIDVLREEITQTTTAVFGVAYVGYLPTDLSQKEGDAFAQWLSEEAAFLNTYYPFITEIDSDHTVGTEGNLYCIIARDYESAITVTATDTKEVLYHSENGDPILVFANWNEELRSQDIVITVTANNINYQWYPSLDQNGYPNLLIGPERELLSWDFSLSEETDDSPETLLADGWFGPDESDFGETIWWTDNEWNSVRYCLTFYGNANDSSDGEAVLECYFENDPHIQAEWQGWWRLEAESDQASRLELDLMLMDGVRKENFEPYSVISESYSALLSPSGTTLRIFLTEDTTNLPIFPDDGSSSKLVLSVR